MVAVTKSRMESMTAEEVLHVVQNAATVCNVHVLKVWVNMNILRLVALVENSENIFEFEGDVRGVLVGWYNDSFEYIEETEAHIDDNDCPDIFVETETDNFEVFTAYEGGILVEYGRGKTG